MQITIYNEFHNTEARVRVSGTPAALSCSQIRRIRRKLCGIPECKCGSGPLNERGLQDVDIEEMMGRGTEEGPRVWIR